MFWSSNDQATNLLSGSAISIDLCNFDNFSRSLNPLFFTTFSTRSPDRKDRLNMVDTGRELSWFKRATAALRAGLESA
jgi:hypothetical protein